MRRASLLVWAATLTACQPTEAQCPAEPPGDCKPAFSDEGIDPVEHLNRGEGDTFIEILDVVPDGDILYSCTGTQGLTIWDVSDADESELLAEGIGPDNVSHGTFPRCQHVTLDADNKRIVITSRGDEVQKTPWVWLYDVSNPKLPFPEAGWFGNRSIEGTAIQGGRIWAATHTDGISVFQWEDDALALVGSYADPESDAWQPIKVGDDLFVAEGGTGLRIYDISADDPVLRSTLPIAGSSRDLILQDDRAYVATSGAIAIVDVSDRDAPEILGEVSTAGTALELSPIDDGVIVVAEWDRIRGYDVSDPAAARQVFSEEVPTDDVFSRVLTAAGDPQRGRIYAGEWRGMHVFDYRGMGRGPDVFTSPNNLQFGTVAKGDTDDRVLVIENQGNEPLTVYEIASATDVLSSDAECLEVPAGGKAAAEVFFEPDSRREIATSLKVCSNDVDEPEYEVAVTANVEGRDIGDDVPSFTLFDLEGNRWTEEDLEGKVAVLAYFATF